MYEFVLSAYNCNQRLVHVEAYVNLVVRGRRPMVPGRVSVEMIVKPTTSISAMMSCRMTQHKAERRGLKDAPSFVEHDPTAWL